MATCIELRHCCSVEPTFEARAKLVVHQPLTLE